jgi:hypothetical protein
MRRDTYESALSMCRDIGYEPAGGYTTIDFWRFKEIGSSSMWAVDFQTLLAMHHGWTIAINQMNNAREIK